MSFTKPILDITSVELKSEIFELVDKLSLEACFIASKHGKILH